MILSELMYSTERRGPFRLYRYNRKGYHTGGQWFEVRPKLPKEAITAARAKVLAAAALADGREVRITDGDDRLVLHAVGSNLLHPLGGAEKFWQEVFDADRA